MNRPFEDEDIIKFIRDEMSAPDRATFEKELDSNKDLVDQVDNVRLALAAIDRRGEQHFKQRFKNLEKRNLIRRWVYILLAIISILMVGWFNKKAFINKKEVDHKVIYAENFQKYRSPVAIRNTENIGGNMSNAALAYRNDEYAEAFRLFDLECDESNQEACFYSVLSAVYEGGINYDNAKNTLVDNSPYAAIVLWYEALAFMQMDNKDEAIKYFEALIENGTYKKSESRRIIELLR